MSAPHHVYLMKPHADADCVALLCAMGALHQKPRAQHFGPFLQHFMPQLQHCSREQLVQVLAAMAQLQLSNTDTQVCARVLASLSPCLRCYGCACTCALE